MGASLRLSATVRVPVVAAASATAICTRSSGWPLLESWALAKVLVTEPSLTLRFVGWGIVEAGCVGPASAAGEAAVAAGVSVVAAGVGAVVGLVSGASSVFGARFVVARSRGRLLARRRAWRRACLSARRGVVERDDLGLGGLLACWARGASGRGRPRGWPARAPLAAAPEEEKTLPGQELKGIAPLAAYPPAMTDAARHEPAATEARRERRGDTRMLLLSASRPGTLTLDVRPT